MNLTNFIGNFMTLMFKYDFMCHVAAMAGADKAQFDINHI